MKTLWLVFTLLCSPLVLAEPVDFTLPDLEGKSRSLSEFRGKWVILNYWATWCPPCLEEIPDLVAFHERHRDKDAVVLGINYEDIPLEQLRTFVDEYFISYPVLVNGDLSAPDPRLSVGGLPTTYIISPQGEPVARQVGGITAKALEDYLARKLRDAEGGR
ncbi:TlpA disulfide reductase family protein [Thiohalobacter sp. IOR34]|uniref:TlpA family protein disulfide reductase n=1 Tax=Thiohalobacter sp. IOR34 TaxID=3057176 RepID=UPI0025B1380D|nr:TlpA disulfide reductase family protein [Thiohalobacter sp. IOR34]WJW76126.1 TlpA disulfide reductase family protein [Thiohalobacter sp. IOR34]